MGQSPAFQGKDDQGNEMRNLNDQSFSELLGLIYEAPLQPDGWRGVLSGLSNHIPASVLNVVHLQREMNAHVTHWTRVTYTTHGLSPGAERSLMTYWAYQIPLTPDIIALTLRHRQAIVTQYQSSPDFDFERSAFNCEFARPNDFHDMLGVSAVDQDRKSMFILSINRPKRFGSFENRDRRLMTELIPHLLRAHRIGQTVQDLQLVQGLQASALDQTTAPVLGLGRNARLLYTNKAADTLLHSEQVFRVQAGHLQALRPAEQQSLLCALHRTAQIGVEIGGCPHDHLTFAREQAAPLSGTLLPVSPSHPERGFTLLLKDPALRRTPPLLLLQHLFTLTPAEARVATLLTEGHSPEEIAGQLGTATATVRNQLKQVFAKTGVRRQGELIRLTLNLA